MSAPTSSAPLVVNTRDGACWTRRTVTEGGIALYALADVCKCPEFVMATLAELAERGIVGSADVLPVPVVPESQEPRRGPLWSLLEWSFWGAGMGDVFRLPLADTMLAAVSPEIQVQAERIMADFIERRKIEKTGVTVYQEQRDELERLRSEVAALRAERHSTNEALDDAVQELRRRETGPALPWAHTMPDDDLSGFLNDLVSAAVNRWQSDPEVPDRETLAAVEKACAAWRTPGRGYRSDEDEPAEVPPLVVFRASHDSIVMGLYTTAAEARKHCEADERRSWGAGHTLVFDWIEDDEDGVAELMVTAGQNEESTTGYVVEAREVASAYDPDADE